MNTGTEAIKLMGRLMSRPSVDIDTILTLVEVLNQSYFECQKIIIILDDVFSNQKSGKILLAVDILEYLVKNCNKNFHQAANKQSFQNKVLSLLKRMRGKTNFLKDLRSNSDNWNKIEAKILYLIQLWYDAFMLDQSVYENIINTYKLLRKQNVMFPPRSANQKNLLAVKTQSPILENIEDIARQDQSKFNKKLISMGMKKQAQVINMMIQQQQKKRVARKIDLDDFSLKIAIVRSNQYQGSQMIKLIQEIKKDLQHGQVQMSQQKFWKDIREAAELLIADWQQKNSELIKEHERRFLQRKLGLMSKAKESQIKPQKQEINDLLMQQPKKQEIPNQKQQAQQINLLDL